MSCIDAEWARASLWQRARWWGTPGAPDPIATAGRVDARIQPTQLDDHTITAILDAVTHDVRDQYNNSTPPHRTPMRSRTTPDGWTYSEINHRVHDETRALLQDIRNAADQHAKGPWLGTTLWARLQAATTPTHNRNDT